MELNKNKLQLINAGILILTIDQELQIIKFRGDASKISGYIEVRGIVNKDATLSFGEFT